jgi:hypothetical protein
MEQIKTPETSNRDATIRDPRAPHTTRSGGTAATSSCSAVQTETRRRAHVLQTHSGRAAASRTRASLHGRTYGN